MSTLVPQNHMTPSITMIFQDAKPFLDQIASDDVCEGKLKDYVPSQVMPEVLDEPKCKRRRYVFIQLQNFNISFRYLG